MSKQQKVDCPTEKAENMSSDVFGEFVGQYQVSKTLRFELKPVGRTMETFKERFLQNDIRRNDNYESAKELLDGEHKALLERVLSNPPPDIDWGILEKGHEDYRRSDKSKEAKTDLANVQMDFRKMISALLKTDEAYKFLTAATPEKMFAEMRHRLESAGVEKPEALETFSGFAGFFVGYQENRRNIYSDEAQATSAAYRAINENFAKFYDDCRLFRYIAETYQSIVSEASAELSQFLPEGTTLDSLFCSAAYSKFLSQVGIDFFNQVLGGFVEKDGRKIRGLNEFINLYKQQHEEARKDHALAPLRQLYKQILSDRTSASFVPDAIESDEEACALLRTAFNGLGIGEFRQESNSLDELKSVLQTINPSNGIWIDGSKITSVSQALLGSWSALRVLMESAAERLFASESTEKKRMAAVEKWMKKEVYSLADLSGLQGENGPVGIAELWKGPLAAKMFEDAKSAISGLLVALGPSNDGKLRNIIPQVKAALDAVLCILHFVQPLHAGEGLDRDAAFYDAFDRLYALLDGFVPLYNRIRNYLTQKPGERGKDAQVKVMFDNPTLASGWDLNKEKDNSCVLFLREGGYYLGVTMPGEKVNFHRLSDANASGGYRKMVYKLLPGPNKMLPKVFFSAKNRAENPPPADILDIYESGTFKKGPTFSLAHCHRLIDYFKASIAAHREWSEAFDFKFSPTSSYSDIGEFYKEVADQGYRVTFENIPAEAIDRLVAEGKLCLFRIWNKHMSPNATGRKNLHTMYWDAVFSPENLKDIVAKLCGGAEIFYRPRIVENPTRHRVGEKMVNRRGKDGRPVPESVHGEVFRYVNGKTDVLSAEAKALLDSGNLVIKDVAHEIVKDRRFTEEKMFFHVPILLNFKATPQPHALNEQVRDFLRRHPDMNVIGIDRGERNLVYLTLIDAEGNVLEQKSLNTVKTVRHDGVPVCTDYQAKLHQAEKGRDAARKSWAEIGGIKDIKEGYLSAVVYEVAKMMIEHNAVVVLEDLNFGFKRGRFRIEKQVYQNFEKALIAKLNYLVFKGRTESENGGVLHGYQLTDRFVSFERIGKQTGFLFYVPAGYTSKIDPTTGFTNLFNTKKCTNAAGIKEFFSQFDAIRWDAGRGAFAFVFNYAHCKTSQDSPDRQWTAYSASRRIVFDTKEKKRVEINPTDIMLNALKTRGVEVADGFDLKEYLASTEASRANAGLFSSVFYAFDRSLQMRNTSEDEDYIESPVINAHGEFFDSRRADDSLPKDADANGAYHIALKGLMLVRRIREAGDGRVDLKIPHADWFAFAQDMSAGKVR